MNFKSNFVVEQGKMMKNQIQKHVITLVMNGLKQNQQTQSGINRNMISNLIQLSKVKDMKK